MIRRFQRFGQGEVRLRVGLGVVRHVEFRRIASAHVHESHHARRHAVETARQMVDAEGERVCGIASDDRLVDLDPRAAGVGEELDLGVESVDERRAKPARVARSKRSSASGGGSARNSV